jgi:hypothetical protein
MGGKASANDLVVPASQGGKNVVPLVPQSSEYMSLSSSNGGSTSPRFASVPLKRASASLFLLLVNNFWQRL